MQYRSKPHPAPTRRDSRPPRSPAEATASGVNDSRFESAWELQTGLQVAELDGLPDDFPATDSDDAH